MEVSIRKGYEALGVDNYYKKHESDYSNPHYPIIKELLNDYVEQNDIGKDILDLCCGSGEVSKVLIELNRFNIEGNDPYTSKLYRKETGLNCYEYSFKDIVCGSFNFKQYDTIICSFAMHLCEESMLNNLIYQLSLITNRLIILTPHKRPNISNNYFKLQQEKIKDRVRLRVYNSSSNSNI